MTDDKVISQALEVFARAEHNETENRKCFRDDIRFARLSKQWPDDVERQRVREGRPILTINKLAPVIRQVVNDSRLNRPSITVRPVDGDADTDTAEIMTGLIRNIEQSSDADIAYDTAIDNAVSGGFGYWRINLDYAHDVDPSSDLTRLGPEAFEKDIVFERVVNSLSVYGDPDSTSATSEDWNVAFVIEDMALAEFKRKYPKADTSGFQADSEMHREWITDKTVRVAEYWTREATEKAIVAVAFEDGEPVVLSLEDFEARKDEIASLGGQLIGPPRVIPTYKVRMRKITAHEVLEDTEWMGRYIPIVPVYGDEVYSDGKRHLRSLIRDAKDPNRMFNYWRTTSTELVALAPRAPFIAEEDSLIDLDKWETANTVSHAYLEHQRGTSAPERAGYAGIPAGALQETLNASDDVKAVTGIYDASLGARSNETSGVAINARKVEGDVASFHFIDNLTRAITHAGRIILDLIPKVYSTPRIIRILGEDGTAESVPVNGANPLDQTKADEIQKVYDLRVGRYDLAVTAGPSFTTRRQEAATQMIELLRSFPDAAPVIGDLLAKNLDWPGADEMAKRMRKLLPPELQDESDGQVQAMSQQMQALQQRLAAAEGRNEIEAFKAETERMEAQTEAFEAQTDRIEAMQPRFVPGG